MPVQAVVVGERFGLAHFATIMAVLTLIIYSGNAGGQVLAGHIFNNTQSYHGAFVIFLAFYVVAIAFILFVRRPKSD